MMRVVDHRFKLEQKIDTESPYAGSILFRSGPIFSRILQYNEIKQILTGRGGGGDFWPDMHEYS